MPFYNAQEKGRPVTIKDEGVTLTSNVSSIDMTGAGVNATNIGDGVTEDVPNNLTIGSEVVNGITGSVLFVGATGNLGQDNANLFWDNINNRLGLGTATPATRLNIGDGSAFGTAEGISFGDGDTVIYEVADDTLEISTGGTVRSSINVSGMFMKVSGGALMRYAIPSLTNPAYSFRGDTDTGIGRNGADTLAFITGGVNCLNIVETAGIAKVGINQATPLNQLHIKDSSDNPQLRLEYSGAAMSTFEVDSGGNLNIAIPAGNLDIGASKFTTTGDINGANIIASSTVTGVNVTSGANPGHTHTGISLSDIDISNDTNLAGTANQIILTGDTLSTPQDIHTSATPQFARLGLGIAADGTNKLHFPDNAILGMDGRMQFMANTDISSGDFFVFGTKTGIELTGSSGQQSMFYINGKVNQSGTASYNALRVNMNETALGSGTSRVMAFSVNGSNRILFGRAGAGIFTDGTGSVITLSPTNDYMRITDGSTTYDYGLNGIAVPTNGSAFHAAAAPNAKFVFSGTTGFTLTDTGGATIFAVDAQTTDAGHTTISNDTATSTNYYKMLSLDNGGAVGVTIWIANNANPNTNLTGTAGDMCLSTNGNIYRCTGTTNWTAM